MKNRKSLTREEKKLYMRSYNLTEEEKGSCIIHRAVDGYKYTAIHLGHNEYKVIRVDPIDRDPLEAEMRKLFGDEYDKYFNW